MKIIATAFALVAATSIAAYAQGTGMPAAPSASPSASDQCWDLATNSVKNTQGKTLSQSESSSAGASANPSTAPAAKAPSPRDSMAKAVTPPGGSATANRPAGIPNC